eukprot:3670369-Ditylum_brightwellii.AAC.1
MTNQSKQGGSSASERTNLTSSLSAKSTITSTKIRELLEGIRALRELGVGMAASNNAATSNSATMQGSSSSTCLLYTSDAADELDGVDL